MAYPFAQLKGTYAANESFHLTFALLIVVSCVFAIITSYSFLVPRLPWRWLVVYGLMVFLRPSITHLLKGSICCAAFLAQKILLWLYSLHFQLPYICGCASLTNSLDLVVLPRYKWHVRVVLCMPMRPIPLSAIREHTSGFLPFMTTRPLLIICWYLE